jgi:DNA-binding transcriptional ArsR family regulator
MVRPAEESDAFAAVACPTRRKIIELLAERERPVGELVDHLRITQPSVSEQLRILRDVGIVQARQEGRRRLYSLNPTKIKPVAVWATTFSKFWDRKLEALSAHLAKKKSDKPTNS